MLETNNAGWIKGVLATLRFLDYLAMLIESYLPERFIWHETEDKLKQYIATTGALKESILNVLTGGRKTYLNLYRTM